MDIERDVELNVARPNDPVEATLVENRDLRVGSTANFCRHIAFDVSGSPLEGSVQSGQAFGVIPDWENHQEYNDIHIKSDDTKLRLYSNASPKWGEDGEGKIISTTVKRVIDEHEETHELFLGVCSNYLCDLEEGSTVQLTGPTGRHFLLPDEKDLDDYQYIFFGAGTGIAPFRGMVQELHEADISGECHMIFGVPYSSNVWYRDFFVDYEEKWNNFQFHRAISREQTTEDGEKMYVQRRLKDQWDHLGSLIQNQDTLIYICGLEGMETGIYRVLLEKECMDYFKSVPEDLMEEDPTQISDRDERLGKIRPNKSKLLVEVY